MVNRTTYLSAIRPLGRGGPRGTLDLFELSVYATRDGQHGKPLVTRYTQGGDTYLYEGAILAAHPMQCLGGRSDRSCHQARQEHVEDIYARSRGTRGARRTQLSEWLGDKRVQGSLPHAHNVPVQPANPQRRNNAGGHGHSCVWRWTWNGKHKITYKRYRRWYNAMKSRLLMLKMAHLGENVTQAVASTAGAGAGAEAAGSDGCAEAAFSLS